MGALTLEDGPGGMDQATNEPRQRADLPGPLMRRGPRPLLLHLMLAAMKSNASVIASPGWSSVWPTSKPPADSRAGAAPPRDAHSDPEPATTLGAVLESAMREDAALIAGIAAYRRHPAQRSLRDPAPIWVEGEARLLDYAPGSPGAPVVFVPSLINRGYILDLAPRNSLLRFLARSGVRPLLLDWGWPGAAERRYTLTDYIAGLLDRAIASVGQPVVLVGYCMGGLLAVAAAQRRPQLVSGLGVLATPWDFRAGDPAQADSLAQLLPLLKPILDFNSTVPIDVLQSFFAMLDPDAVARKFRRFGRLDQDGARARLFVAIEDWANDGVPLSAPVARECFADWYGRNTPMLGLWRVAGMPVLPAALDMPCFAAVPGQDRIVPPESAWPLARMLPRAQVIAPAAGHVSMVAGSGAETVLWRPLLDWLRAL
jgi:pimeloyl-ACP methyl ester carboxylesterase